MGKQRKNYPLRLSADLFEEIRRWAEQEMRSVNGQMEYILRQAVNARKNSMEGSKTKDDGLDEQRNSDAK